MPKRFILPRPKLMLVVLYHLLNPKSNDETKKLEAAYMAINGRHTAQQIADRVGISRRQFFAWMSVLKRGKLDDLLVRHHAGGRAPHLSPPQQAALNNGLREGRWQRPSDVQKWLANEFGIHLSRSGVRLWMAKATTTQSNDRPASRKRVVKRVWMEHTLRGSGHKLDSILIRLNS